MANSTEKTKAEIYREERKRRLAKQKKKMQKMTPQKAKRKKVVKRVILSFVAVVLVLVLSAGIVFATGIPNRYLTAMTVGDHNITVAEYNFYYYTSYQSFLSQYGEYASMFGLDTTKSLDSQNCAMSTGTWADYFAEQATEQIKKNMVLIDAAKEENITLNEEDKAQIEVFMTALKEQSRQQKVPVTKMFGKGATEQSIREAYTNYTLALRYGTYKRSTYTYDDAALQAEYEANKDTYDVSTYRTYAVTSTAADDADEATKEAAMKEAKKKADDMLAKITDEKSFAEQVRLSIDDEQQKETYKDDDATLRVDQVKSTIANSSQELADWLFSTSRKTGDKTVAETDKSYVIAYMVTPVHRQEYKTVNVRHVLSAINDTTDDAAAKQKADDILAEFNAGDKSEDSFAKLATEKTDDTGSAANGGLYSNVKKGDMVTEFNDWCFDPSRKAADTAVVKTDYGYHVMYFVGYGEPQWKVAAKENLTDKDYNAFYDAKAANYTIDKNSFSMFFAQK